MQQSLEDFCWRLESASARIFTRSFDFCRERTLTCAASSCKSPASRSSRICLTAATLCSTCSTKTRSPRARLLEQRLLALETFLLGVKTPHDPRNVSQRVFDQGGVEAQECDAIGAKEWGGSGWEATGKGKVDSLFRLTRKRNAAAPLAIQLAAQLAVRTSQKMFCSPQEDVWARSDSTRFAVQKLYSGLAWELSAQPRKRAFS